MALRFGSYFVPIEKPLKPTVGFVGATQYPGRINSIFRYLPLPNFILNMMICSRVINRSIDLRMRMPIAQQLRERILKAALTQNLTTSIIKRNGCYFNDKDEGIKRYKREYIQNIQNNAYTLCVRGTENYSYRLYEVMSAGRIPIIIDTNMQLPDLGSLKWDEFSVIVPYSDVDSIGDIVQTFHDKMSDDDFRQVCIKSRTAFEYLLPHNFMLNALKKKLELI